MWSVKAGLKAGLDKTILSTDIRGLSAFLDPKVAIKYRQKGLGDDKILVREVFKHMFEGYYAYYPEFIVILQPSSPFVRPSDIKFGIEQLKLDQKAHSFQTLCEINHIGHSYNQRAINPSTKYIQFAHPERRGGSNRKQDYPKHYALGNLIITRMKYFAQMGDFFGNSLYKVIPEEYCVDIDYKKDFEEAERLWTKGKVKI